MDPRRVQEGTEMGKTYRVFLAKLTMLALLSQPTAWAANPAGAHHGKSHKAGHAKKAAAAHKAIHKGHRSAVPPEGAHTSLIIDARGTNLSRGMGPRIYSQSGQLVYGNFESNWEYAQERGVVSYVSDMKSATMLPDAGGNPLVVKLAAVHGEMNSDGIVDDASAAAIEDAATKWDFLHAQKVIIVTEN